MYECINKFINKRIIIKKEIICKLINAYRYSIKNNKLLYLYV